RRPGRGLAAAPRSFVKTDDTVAFVLNQETTETTGEGIMPRVQLRTLCGALALALITLVAGLPAKVRAADDPKEPGDRKPQGEAPAKPQGMTPEGILGLLATGQDGRRTAKWLEDAFEGQPKTEAAEMLIAIARGSQMGPGEGWFHPGQGRYNWEWLAARHG